VFYVILCLETARMLADYTCSTGDIDIDDNFELFPLDSMHINWVDDSFLSPSSENNTFGSNSFSTDSISLDRSDDSDGSVWAIASQQSAKQRVKDRRWNLIPKVLKYDVRRYYAQMLANAMNSIDVAFLRSFFNNYSVPNMAMTKGPEPRGFSKGYIDDGQQNNANSNVNPQGYSYIQLQGIDAVAQFWTLVCSCESDSVVKVSETKIISRINTTSSTVVTDFQTDITMTRYNEFVKAVAELMRTSKEQTSTISKKRRREEGGGLTAMTLQQLHAACTADAKLLPKPVPVKITGKLVMELDERKRIEHLNFGPVAVMF